jgi:hypothetical protein
LETTPGNRFAIEREVRLGILVVVGLSAALELGCAARPAPVRTQTRAARSAESTSSRDPSKKLREGPEAAKRKGPLPRQQGVDRTVDLYADAPPESRTTAVRTSGDGLPPSPTASAPAPQVSTPPSPDKAPTGAHASAPESRQARNIFIGLACVATVLLLIALTRNESWRGRRRGSQSTGWRRTGRS